MINLDETRSVLYDCINSITNKDLKKICLETVYNNERFQSGFGSRNKHHAYRGGLLQHTYEVINTAYNMANSLGLQPVNNDIIIAGGLFHDFGKIYDYEERDGKMEYTSHGDLIYHVAHSYAEFFKVSAILPFDLREQISHVILAHHGRKEWGSPVEPKTLEAQAVHYADMLSWLYSNNK